MGRKATGRTTFNVRVPKQYADDIRSLLVSWKKKERDSLIPLPDSLISYLALKALSHEKDLKELINLVGLSQEVKKDADEWFCACVSRYGFFETRRRIEKLWGKPLVDWIAPIPSYGDSWGDLFGNGTVEDKKKRYRELISRFHPDRHNQDPDAIAVCQAVNHAWDEFQYLLDQCQVFSRKSS